MRFMSYRIAGSNLQRNLAAYSNASITHFPVSHLYRAHCSQLFGIGESFGSFGTARYGSYSWRSCWRKEKVAGTHVNIDAGARVAARGFPVAASERYSFQQCQSYRPALSTSLALLAPSLTALEFIRRFQLRG